MIKAYTALYKLLTRNSVSSPKSPKNNMHALSVPYHTWGHLPDATKCPVLDGLQHMSDLPTGCDEPGEISEAAYVLRE